MANDNLIAGLGLIGLLGVIAVVIALLVVSGIITVFVATYLASNYGFWVAVAGIVVWNIFIGVISGVNN